MNRIKVVMVGCLIWSIMTWMFGLARWASSPLVVGSIVWSLNGLGLALVVPNSQSIIADYHSEGNRGRAFGLLCATASFGAVLGSVYATNVAGLDFGWVRGWQFVMFSLAMVSAVVGLVSFKLGTDPRDVSHDQELDGRAKVKLSDAVQGIKSVIVIPSFLIIILQGIVGSMPWKAIAAFGTLYFQLIGMSNAKASILMCGFLVGTMVGALLGGWLGDTASRYYPNHGRIFVCQFSVFSGVPLTYIVFMVVPKNGTLSSFLGLLCLIFVEGLLISWATPACNGPIFAEIVPPGKRTLVYAFDRCFEDSLASPVIYLVGWAASAIFGYTGEATATGHPDIDLERADALGRAIMWFSVIPWFLCLAFYTGLHFTYSRDRDLAAYAQILECPKGN